MQIICSRVQRVNACGIFRRDSSGLLFTLILHKQYPEARAKRCDISHRNCRYVLMCLLQLLISLASGNWIPLRYGRKINMRNNQPNWVTFDKDNRRKLKFKIICVCFCSFWRSYSSSCKINSVSSGFQLEYDAKNMLKYQQRDFKSIAIWTAWRWHFSRDWHWHDVEQKHRMYVHND